MSRFLDSLSITLEGRHQSPPLSSAWEATRKVAEDAAQSPLRGQDVIDRPAGWGHNYFCPTHGGALHFAENQPDYHICPVGDHQLVGEQYDTGWAYVRNNMLLDYLHAAAVAGRVSADEAHTRRAIDLLLGLAEVYHDLPLHGTKVGQAKFMHQSLEEAVAATQLARSYALVADKMTENQREYTVRNLFIPMGEVIEDHLMHRIHNIEVWHLAGIASLAVVLEDHGMAERTLQGPTGFLQQLKTGVLEDGWWFEGSPGYHFYMLTAVLNGVESYQALGIKSAGTDILEKMLLTPIEMARRDLTLPAFNDCSLVTAVPPGIGHHADLYFRGARLCASDALNRFLKSSHAEQFDRSTVTYLLYGDPSYERDCSEVGSSSSPVSRRDVYPDSGYAVLRAPAAHGDTSGGTSVFIKYGPHGEGHGQPDKLEIDLMVDGARVIADPGTEMYTNPLHRPWYVQTWSHSTVLIDRISQPPVQGKLLGHRSVASDAFGCVDSMVTFGEDAHEEGVNVLWHMDDPAPVAAYAGVTMRRILVMTPPDLGEYLLDLVLVNSLHSRCIDLITHVRGHAHLPAGRPATDRVLLPQFSNVRRMPEPSGRTDYTLSDGARPFTRFNVGAQELLTATTPSNPPHERCATSVERVVGPQAALCSVIPLRQDNISGVTMSTDRIITVATTAGKHEWELIPELQAQANAPEWSTPPISLQAHHDK